MKSIFSPLILLTILSLLGGCAPSDDQKDLKDFMAETKRRPHGQIDPLPAFKPFQPFTYGAMTLRSPFEKPIPIESQNKGGRAVEPDLNREKEYLEGFNIASLRMVGTVIKEKAFWALIDDGQGGVKPVTVGNHMGKSFGKIVSIDKNQMEVLEIVSDGSSGWIERPRIIKLETKE